MERLKKALGHPEAPDCPNCRFTMRWFRSELVRDTPEPLVAHLSFALTASGLNEPTQNLRRFVSA